MSEQGKEEMKLSLSTEEVHFGRTECFRSSAVCRSGKTDSERKKKTLKQKKTKKEMKGEIHKTNREASRPCVDSEISDRTGKREPAAAKNPLRGADVVFFNLISPPHFLLLLLQEIILRTPV